MNIGANSNFGGTGELIYSTATEAEFALSLFEQLGIPRERMVVNVDRYGNTSSGSIPLALAEAQADGRLKEGDLVLMTGMGAGLTWGSALMEWTQ